jgi:hypothetical protein
MDLKNTLLNVKLYKAVELRRIVKDENQTTARIKKKPDSDILTEVIDTSLADRTCY